jgi:hypothetical protein
MALNSQWLTPLYIFLNPYAVSFSFVTILNVSEI